MSGNDYTALFTTLASVGGTVVAIVGGITGTRHVQLQAQLEGSAIARHEAGIRLSQAEAAVEEARKQTWPSLIKEITGHDAFLDQLYVMVTDWRRHARNGDVREACVQELERLVGSWDVKVWPNEADLEEVWEHLERVWDLASATLADFEQGVPDLTPETPIESIWAGPPAREELGCRSRPIKVYRIWRGLLVRAARERLFDDHVERRRARDVREDLQPVFERYAAVVLVAMNQRTEAERAQIVTLAAAPALPVGLRSDLVVLAVVALLGVVPPILYLTPGGRHSPVSTREAITVMLLFLTALLAFFLHLSRRLSLLRREHGGRTMAYLRPPAGRS